MCILLELKSPHVNHSCTTPTGCLHQNFLHSDPLSGVFIRELNKEMLLPQKDIPALVEGMPGQLHLRKQHFVNTFSGYKRDLRDFSAQDRGLE